MTAPTQGRSAEVVAWLVERLRIYALIQRRRRYPENAALADEAADTLAEMQRRVDAVVELYGRLCGQVDDSKADFGWKIIRNYRDELREILFGDAILGGDGKEGKS